MLDFFHDHFFMLVIGFVGVSFVVALWCKNFVK